MLREDKRAHIEKQLIGALILLGAVAASPGANAEPRSLSGSVNNGLIAYSYKGDIYVGDPDTGETEGDRHQTRVRGESDLRSWRPKDRIHTGQSTNREGEGRRGSNRRFPRAPHLSEGTGAPGPRELRVDTKRRRTRRATRQPTVLVSARRRRAFALRFPRQRQGIRPHPAPATVDRRPLLGPQPGSADVSPPFGRPHPVG